MAIADPVSRPARLTAVDVPRSAALLEMMAMHALVACGDEASHDGDARRRQPLRRRSSLVADVSLAFMSCGRRDAQGRDRTGAGASLVVRASLIGVIGLALGMLEQESGVEGILPFYDVLFLLAIPLLGLPLLALAGRAHRLAAAWAKVLGVGQDQIGRLDHFFDRGHVAGGGATRDRPGSCWPSTSTCTSSPTAATTSCAPVPPRPHTRCCTRPTC